MSNTEDLIELVKKFPLLYDPSVPENRDMRSKERAWKQIGAQLNESGEEVKKKWKNLRDTYIRSIRTDEKKKGGKYFRKWRWSNRMEPFRRFFVVSKTSCNVVEVQESQENSAVINDFSFSQNSQNGEDVKFQFSCENTEDHLEKKVFEDFESDASHYEHGKINEKIKLEPSDSVHSDMTSTSGNNENESLSPLNCEMAYFPKTINTEIDETEMFFIALARTVKKLSRKRQAIAKMQVSKIVMEQELLGIKEQTLLCHNQDH